MAGRTAARPVITRMIVAPHKVEQWIVQPRLREIQKDWIDAVQGPKSTLAQPPRGFAGRLVDDWDTQGKLLLAALLKDAQNVARLADDESRQRIDEREHAIRARLFRRRNVRIQYPQRFAVGPVSLSVAIILQRKRAIIVERRAPEHRAMTHHAVPCAGHFAGVTGAARLLRHAQVTWVDELDELRRLVIQ